MLILIIIGFLSLLLIYPVNSSSSLSTITCTPIHTTTHRLINGEQRFPRKDKEENQVEEKGGKIVKEKIDPVEETVKLVKPMVIFEHEIQEVNNENYKIKLKFL